SGFGAATAERSFLSDSLSIAGVSALPAWMVLVVSTGAGGAAAFAPPLTVGGSVLVGGDGGVDVAGVTSFVVVLPARLSSEPPHAMNAIAPKPTPSTGARMYGHRRRLRSRNVLSKSGSDCAGADSTRCTCSGTPRGGVVGRGT